MWEDSGYYSNASVRNTDQNSSSKACAESIILKKSTFFNMVIGQKPSTRGGTMFPMWSVCLVVMCVLPIGLCFNVDIRTHVLHQHIQGSMFGFTVDQYHESNVNWLLVGAPEDTNYTHDAVDRPGAVYRCPMTRNACQQIVFDKTGQETRYIQDENKLVQVSNKSRQWFGATVASSSEHGYILACAPRFVYFTLSTKKREVIGSCFIRQKGGAIKSYYPCKTETSIKIDGADKVYCQAGISGRLFNASKIVLGAVGSFYWQGQLMIQDIEDALDVRETLDSKGHEDDSYTGYAVASGHFDNDSSPDIVVSAPRNSYTAGIIKLYTANLRLLKTLSGANQIGEYFGYCLAVDDFNGDGFDDIAVGAPFYADYDSGMFEMGHVYVFYQNAKHNFTITQLYGDKETQARFGTSLSSLKDINDDNYTDLVVGAPYGGKDGKGAIYIYQGGPQQILPRYSQKINALDISSTLSTFGFSVKGGMDQDNNLYPDIAVGAYESAGAVFLRSRSVIKMQIELTPSPREINLEKFNCQWRNRTAAVCFTLKTCIIHGGKGVPNTIDIKGIWFLDAVRQSERRVHFYEGTESDQRKERLFTLNRSKGPDCSESRIVVKDNIRDKLTPIVIRFNYSLILGTPVPDQLQPVLDYYNSTAANTSIKIEKNCGNDDICIPDLQLNLSSISEKYVFGQEEELEIRVLATNLGEESYETQLFLDFPSGVTYINIGDVVSKTTVSCTVIGVDTGEILICNIGNPLPANRTVEFTVRIHPQNITSSVNTLTFNAVVNSTNAENKTDYHNNAMSTDIKMAALIELSTTGVSLPEQVLYNSTSVEEIISEEDIGPKFTHRYVVTNNGPSALSSLSVSIYWPETLSDGSLIFYLANKPIVKGNGSCDVKLIDINNVTDYVYTPKEKEGILESAIKYMFGESPEDKDDSGEKNFKLNCEQRSRNYCKKITCMIGHLDNSDSVIIEVNSRVFINTMINVLKAYRGVLATSLAESVVLTLPYDNVVLDNVISHNNTVETFVTAIDIGAGQGEVPWWVIALAIVGGAIMLLLVVFGLCKCGFFKRKKLEDEEDEEKLEKEDHTESPMPVEEKNGKNGQAKAPPKVQIDPDSKNLYQEIPDEEL